jgi:hypothetical protein
LKLAIDIGTEPFDGSGFGAYPYTWLEVANPANADGTLDTVQAWWKYNGTGVKVGTFYLVSGTDYKCRDSELIGDVVSGSAQEYTGLSIDVATDDYIGEHVVTGGIERSDSGGSGLYYASGEHIDPGDQATFTLIASHKVALYGTGTEGGGATEKTGSDTGAGADVKASGSPLAAINSSETASGADSLPSRDIALPDSGAGVDACVSLQTPAAKTASDSGSGVDACVSVQTPVAKSAADTGSGAEAVPVPAAFLAGSESGAGIEAFIARLLAAAETGYGAEASEIGGGGLLKHLFASELGEGADGLTAKIEKPTKGGGMRLWT